MKQAIPALLLLALAACQSTDPAAGSVGQDKEVQTLQSISATASTASQVGAAMGNPAVAGAGAAVAALADAAATSAAKDIPQTAFSKRFEYADVYVTLGDPVGMRALVPYLMKTDEWTLIQCEQMTTTFKHYKFQRLVGPDGKSIPSSTPDPFNTKVNSFSK